MERGDFTDLIFDRKLGDFLAFVVSVPEYFAQQILINLFQFAFTQFLYDLVLLLSQYWKISIFSLSFKLSQVLFVNSLTSQSILYFLYFTIGSECQKIVYLPVAKILSYGIDIEESREILYFKNAFRKHDSLSIIYQIELTLVDDGLLQSFYGVEVFPQNFRDVLNFLLEGFLDLGIVLAPKIDVLSLFEKMRHIIFRFIYSPSHY